MTFKPEFVSEFLTVFEQYKEHIAGAEGCTHLNLLRDIDNPNIFFTYSHWEGPEFLEKYRHGTTFGEVWPKTKIGFAAKPEAWSSEVLH